MKFSYIIILIWFPIYFLGQSQMYLSNDTLDEMVFDGHYYNGYHYFVVAKGEMNYLTEDYEIDLIKFNDLLEPVDTLILDKIDDYSIVSGKIIIVNDTIYVIGSAKNFNTNDVQLYIISTNLSFQWSSHILFGNEQYYESLSSVYKKQDGTLILAAVDTKEYPKLPLLILNCSKKGEILKYVCDSTWSASKPQVIYLQQNNKFYFVDQYITSIYDTVLNHDTTIFCNVPLLFRGYVDEYDMSKYLIGGNGFWVYKKNSGIVQLDDEEDIVEITYYLMDSSAKQVDSGFIAIPYINDNIGGLEFISPNNLIFGGVDNYDVLENYPLHFEQDPRKIVVKNINFDTKEEIWYFEYGGDVNYVMKGLYVDEETGECTVYSERYDWRKSELLQRDILIFKIDSTGLLVGVTKKPSEVENKLTLFPNPGKDRLFMKGISGYSEVTFYDLFGRQVLDAVIGDANEPISTDRLKKGTYFVKVHDSSLNYFEPVIWIKQ